MDTIRTLSALCLLLVSAAPALALDPIPMAPAATSAPTELVEADYGHGIVIQGTPAFVERSVASLDRLATLPSGQSLLGDLGSSGRATVVSETDVENAMAGALDPDKLIDAMVKHSGEIGPGTDAYVKWNPSFELEGTPDWLVLGHELIHALHVHRGELMLNRRKEGRNAGTQWEELRTIGTDGYQDEALTENGLRREWNEANPSAQIPAARMGHGHFDFGDPNQIEGGATPYAFDHEDDHDHGGEDHKEDHDEDTETPAKKRGLLGALGDWLSGDASGVSGH
jgi:NleD-like pathogen effector protein (putative zinc metallopeptidase)